MGALIEDYALLSNCRTAALVSREGSIDWLCLPRLDGASIFAALLGTAEHGCWQLRPTAPDAAAERFYDDSTFVLVTRWTTSDGVVEVREWLDIADDVMTPHTHLLRRIVGVSGRVPMQHSLRLRFDYARALPWVRQAGTAEASMLHAIAGPDAVVLRGDHMQAHGHEHRSEFTVAAGEQRDLVLSGFPSHMDAPDAIDGDTSLQRTQRWWQSWAAPITDSGEYSDLVRRSLLILRALTNRDTGGIAAASTTSLPEEIGGVRNWDYRYVWLRDAALTLEALLQHGYLDSAEHWRNWLVRAVAGDPADVQIMYGLAGERDLVERAIDALPGYEKSTPVRIGNGAAGQYQADVIGEVLVTLAAARRGGLQETERAWAVQRALLHRAEEQIDEPDHGLWEIRGVPRMFTHSRAMMWAAFDRGIEAVREHGMKGPVDRWEELRERLRDEIDTACALRGYFSQHPDTDEVDAALLTLPQVGYCAPDDPRMVATVAKIEETLMHNGFLLRYRTSSGVDGLVGSESPFLACSFWLVEQYAEMGEAKKARELMRRLCSLANDVGMLSEEYDPVAQRHLGNTPQAFSHLGLVRAADAIAHTAHRR
ncbi:glycoside hydrolase family 15 protein [Microbacterium sp. YY-01]|uniref:glycoside hydrolase family 15 protein n=1 Tax=Microbacterium sp. YY-01 TaxID=3421634 RepID=UPI003D1690CC